MAAGLSIKEEHFKEFQSAFESVAQSLLSPADLTRIIETDGALNANEFSLDIARSLEQQVWGQGFPQPLFEGEFTVENQRVVGEKHLKLKLGAHQTSFDAIRFFSADPMPPRIHATYKLAVNEYNGKSTLQLLIEYWEASHEIVL